MKISRSGFIKGLFASTALPAVAPALGAELPRNWNFRTELRAGRPKPWTKPPKAGPGKLRFAVVGDRTGLARPGVFEDALEQISWLEPDFILTVGDAIEGYTDDRGEIDRQWDHVERMIDSAGLPFVFTPGNHDVNNQVTLEAWRERRGALYYSFTYKDALFLILNTEDPPTPMHEDLAKQFYQAIDQMRKDPQRTEALIRRHIESQGQNPTLNPRYEYLNHAKFTEQQLRFVRETLAHHSDVRWTFVILHKPAWKLSSAAFTEITEMLGERPYTVFAGHTHYFTHEKFGGRDYINMATTGGIIQQIGPGTMDHTVLVTLSESGPRYDAPSFANMRLTGLMDIAGGTGQTLAY